VHDDQLGPFARMNFLNQDIPSCLLERDQRNGFVLTTSWHCKDYVYYAFPYLLINPLYHKIRVDYFKIRSMISRFDRVVGLPITRKEHRPLAIDQNTGNLVPEQHTLCKSWNGEWNISLQLINEYKKKLLNLPDSVDEEQRIAILQKPFPRFIWKCTFESNGKPMFDILFDATDVNSGNLFITSVAFNERTQDLYHACKFLDDHTNTKDPVDRNLINSLGKMYKSV